MEGFKNTTRMKTFGDVAPQAYAKGGSVKPMVKAPTKAPAKGKDCAPMKKAGGGDVSKMTRDQRMASMEKSSRAMTPAETRSLQAIKTAKAAAPKQGPLIKPAREMTPAERRMNQMDRPTNSRGAEAYKGGGKVGGSKVPFAVKKVMRKAEGGVVAAPKSEIPILYGADYDPSKPASPPPMPEMPQEPTPQSVFGTTRLPTPIPEMYGTSPSTTHPVMPSGYGTSPGPMPEMPNEPMMPSAPQPAFGEKDLMDLMGSGGSQKQLIDAMNARIRAAKPNPLPGSTPPPLYNDIRGEYTPEMFARDRAQNAARAADQAATLQAQQEMAAQAQQDQGLGRGLAPMYGRGAPPRFMR